MEVLLDKKLKKALATHESSHVVSSSDSKTLAAGGPPIITIDGKRYVMVVKRKSRLK